MSYQESMFQNGEDTPLFSGCAQTAQAESFNPQPQPRQLHLGGCPICEATGLIIPRPGAEAIYCTCQHGDRARAIDRKEKGAT